MNNEEGMKTDGMIEIPKKLEIFISDKGVLTGSFIFGGFTDKSDIDILLYYPTITLRDLLDSNFKLDNTSYDEYDFNCLYGKTESGRILNVLYFTDRDMYNIYEKATRTMTLLLKDNPKLSKHMNIKTNRLNLCSSIREVYKTIIKMI